MKTYVLALDQGTTSSRAIIFDKEGNNVAIAQKEFRQYYPQPGWVEHDAEEIWSSQATVMAEALLKANITADQLAAIGITNQRETTIIWDRKTGEPIGPAIVWQDRRTAAYCDELKAQGKGELIREKTGLIIDSYFSATKIKWMLDNIDGARDKATKGMLAFGTVDSWLVFKLTGGALHITDVTNASRTMLYNIHSLQWDTALLELFDIPSSLLPEVKSSSEVYGETSGKLLAAKVPIAGIAGDQQSALFGQMCTQKGMVKNTYGTGCFMLMNIGDKAIVSKNKLLTTIAWQLNGKVQYALEGSIFIGGAVVQWLRDGLNIIGSSGEVEEKATSVDDNGGVCFVPAFAGLGAPHWDSYARGMMTGITRGTTNAHIARAALESIALQTMEVLHAMEADSELKIKQLRVDGGASANNFLLQFQADVLDTEVVRPSNTETTAMGAAYLAGLAVGFWKDVEEIQKQWKVDKIFRPVKDTKTEQIIKEWHRAVKACKAWSKG